MKAFGRVVYPKLHDKPVEHHDRARRIERKYPILRRVSRERARESDYHLKHQTICGKFQMNEHIYVMKKDHKSWLIG